MIGWVHDERVKLLFLRELGHQARDLAGPRFRHRDAS